MADMASVSKQSVFLGFLALLCVPLGLSAVPPAASGLSQPATGSLAAATGEFLTASGVADPDIWSSARLSAPSFTIHRDVPEVRLQFTVSDELGHPVKGLTAGDVRILDNESAVPRIRHFSQSEDLPLQIGILLDVSDSVHKTVAREKLASDLFLQSVLRPETDRAFVLAFSSESRVWQAPTGDRESLRQSLSGIREQGTATNLYDAVFYACRGRFAQNGDSGIVQRILLLLSDGNDTGSLHALPDAVAQAQLHDVQIYALSIHPKRGTSAGDEILMRLADETGGHFYMANSESELRAVFASMEQQMRTQYSVSFPPAGGRAGFHTLRVEMTNRRKAHIQARQAYYLDSQ